MDLLLFIIVILLILIIYFISINYKKTHLNNIKNLENYIDKITDLDSETEINKIELILEKYNQKMKLSEKNKIIISDLINKLDLIKKDIENPKKLIEFKTEVNNKIIELQKNDKYIFTNLEVIDEIDKKLEETKKNLANNYLKNKNLEIKIDNDDYLKLCNNNKKCILMNVNENGEYTIKSDTINFKNKNDNTIAKIENNNIYLGGDNKNNSGLYINDGQTYINKVNINELLLKDKKNQNMIDIGSYVEWLDDNKNYREYVDQQNYENNVARLKEIDILKDELKKIEENNKFLDIKLNENIDIIDSIRTDNIKLSENDTSILNKFKKIKTELDTQLKTTSAKNLNMELYKDSIDIELIKLHNNIDKIEKDANAKFKTIKVKNDMYDRDGTEQYDRTIKIIEDNKLELDQSVAQNNSLIESNTNLIDENKSLIDSNTDLIDENKSLIDELGRSSFAWQEWVYSG
tara:strand:+ start:142 stop:1530 length:1389 start_codon:yes stop_codon:yes gene_type:complete